MQTLKVKTRAVYGPPVIFLRTAVFTVCGRAGFFTRTANLPEFNRPASLYRICQRCSNNTVATWDSCVVDHAEHSDHTEFSSMHGKARSFGARLSKAITCFAEDCRGERMTRRTVGFTPFHKLSAELLLLISSLSLSTFHFSFQSIRS